MNGLGASKTEIEMAKEHFKDKVVSFGAARDFVDTVRSTGNKSKNLDYSIEYHSNN